MQDSDLSIPSVIDSGLSVGSGSLSEDDSAGSGWFSMSDLTSLARTLKATIPPAIDGLTGAIQRGAMNVAAEFAQMEREVEREATRWREEKLADKEEAQEDLPLPWETNTRGGLSYTADDCLKERILALSKDEETFLKPHTFADSAEDGELEADSSFELDDRRVNQIHRLLAADSRLSKMHAQMSGRSDLKEKVFWKNYFYHCDMIRKEYEADEYIAVSDDDDDDDDESMDFPRTISAGDLVLIGSEGEDLENLASSFRVPAAN
eukprot:scaffold27227_cov45-Attheya_sp.AAC.3